MLRFRGNIPQSTKLEFLAALYRLNVLPAWGHTTGSASIPVGLVGGRLDSSAAALPEFAGKLTVLPKSYPDDNLGVSNSEYPLAMLGAAGGPTGCYGVAYGSPLVYAKACQTVDGSSVISDAHLASAINALFDNGARVVAIADFDEAGAAGDFPLTAAACSRSDRLVFASVGDPFQTRVWPSSPYVPGALSGVIPVGAVWQTDEALGSPSNTHATDERGVVGSSIQIVGPWSGGNLSNGALGMYTPSRWAFGVRVATAFVAGVAQLVWSATPGLTAAQVKDVLLSTVDKPTPLAQWMFDSYVTRAGVGIPDAERAVLKAKALDPANSGTVFPYLRLRGTGPRSLPGRANLGPADEGVIPIVSGGECRILVNGAVGAEIGGYCYVGGVEKPATNVQLWLDGAKVYDGAPTSRAAGNLYQFTSYRNDYYDVRVIASTATGETATRTYFADYDANPATTYSVASYVTDPSLEPVVNTIASPTSDDPIIISGRVPSFLEGGASGAATASGNLSIPVVLHGSASAAATVSADLSTPARLDGSAAGTATASGDLSVVAYLEPTADPHVNAITSPTSDDPIVVSGLVPPWAVLEGGALGTGQATGDLVSLTLGGDAIADSDAAAELTAQAVHALSGDAVASSSAALASGTHTYPVVDVLLSAAERTVYLHHGRVDVVLSASERTVILERRAA